VETIVASSDLKAAVRDFLALYPRRPIIQNLGGMRLNHSFATWFMLKALKPKTIIESGVWQGYSTWLIEQACHDAKIFCLDIDFSRLFYKSISATYIKRDFSQCPWAGIDPASAVCIFDDHQNAYQRLKDMRWAGFKRAIFDDNYPCGEGDCYSLRQMLSGCGHPHMSMGKAAYFGDTEQQLHYRNLEIVLRSVGTQQHALVEPNFEERVLFERNRKSYFEFPPVALTKISALWDKPYEGAYQAKPPIYPETALPAELQAIMAADPREFDYVYIAFVELT